MSQFCKREATTMGKFGWSYPPGCDGPPDAPAICDVCGSGPDACICPECPECGEQGNPRCYEAHGLVRTEEQKASLENATWWMDGPDDTDKFGY